MSTTETRERPILFSGPMIRAILDGTKTQTRRVVVPSQSTPRVPPLTMEPWMIDGEQEVDDHGLPCWAGYHPDYPGDAKWFSCPYGKAGDRLWVREAFTRLWFDQERDWQTFYRADDNLDYVLEAAAGLWKPSIHMPRAYSRISLEIVDVRVERVQDISEADAWAEGVHGIARTLPYSGDDLASVAFSGLWEAINGKRYPWDSNPWVWAIEFKQLPIGNSPPPQRPAT